MSMLAACGSHHAPAITPDGSIQAVVTDGSVHINAGFNDCPVVLITAGPQVARVGEHVAVAAQASDDDTTESLTYAWTAPAGTFADATAASTVYTCPAASEAGPQTITVSVSDGKCAVKRSVTIACDAFADAGSAGDGNGGAVGDGGTVDTGGGTGGADGATATGGTGGGFSCTGDPTKCEGTLCNQCTFGVASGDTDLCTASADGCYNCDPTDMGCDFYTSDAARTKCQALYACIRDSNCVTNEDPTGCWCGTTEVGACQRGATPANGPCLQQFIDAAGSSLAADINQRFIDPMFPIGGAVNLANCRASYCGKGAATSGTPSCPLW